MNCKECEKDKDMANTHELKVCRNCNKTSDEDDSIILYCVDCSAKLNVCQICGKPVITDDIATKMEPKIEYFNEDGEDRVALYFPSAEAITSFMCDELYPKLDAEVLENTWSEIDQPDDNSEEHRLLYRKDDFEEFIKPKLLLVNSPESFQEVVKSRGLPNPDSKTGKIVLSEKSQKRLREELRKNERGRREF